MSEINVFTGPMKSGKSQMIINEANRQMIAGKKIQMFKPKLDTRDYECVADRNGNRLTAINITDIEEIKRKETFRKNGRLIMHIRQCSNDDFDLRSL